MNIFKIKKEFNKLKDENLKLKNELKCYSSTELKFDILEKFIDNMIIICDNKLIITYISPKFLKTTNYTKDDVISKNLLNFCTPESAAVIKNELTKRIEGKGNNDQKRWQFAIYSKNNSTIWLETVGTPIISSTGTFKGVIAISYVKSENNNLTSLISQIENTTNTNIIKLSTAIKHTPISIVITDTKGNIEYVNPFFTKSTGYELNEVIGKNPSVLKSGNTPHEIYKNLWETISSGKIWYGEFENRDKKGGLYLEKASIAPIVDNSGNITSYIAIKEDITKLRQTQQNLINSEKELRNLNAKKDKFFSIIGHDLRGPFSSIAALIKLLKEKHTKYDSKKMDHALTMLNESAESILKLTENLLDWAKTQTGKTILNKEELIFNELINLTFAQLLITAKNKEIELINLNNKNIKFFADKEMISTVIRNLISNALKYTPRGGKIEVNAINENKYIQISIKDNGVGINPNAQDKLFKIEESYSSNGTEHEKGTGLGLVLCKEFIEAHEGKIWYDSTPGMGSTFYFIIPSIIL